MKLGKNLLLLSLVSIIFLAGCTSGDKGGGTAGTGVVITSFAPDIQRVDSSDVTFTAALQNVGERTASSIKVLFFGLSNEWKMGSSAFDKKFDSTISTLAPADSSSKLKGEEGTADFTVTAPAGKTADVTYDASVRVFYDYQTDGDTLLRFIQSSYEKTNPSAVRGIQSHSSTAGPLVINAVARTPVLSGLTTLGRVQFEIQNIGGGRVYSGGLDSSNNPKDIDKVMSIEVIGLGSKGSCAGSTEGDKATLEPTRLVGGKSKIISCIVDVSGITNYADRALHINIKYSYFVDSATQITVTKNLEEKVGTPAGGGTVAAAQACNNKAAGDACHDTDAQGNTFSGKCIDIPGTGGTTRTCVKS